MKGLALGLAALTIIGCSSERQSGASNSDSDGVSNLGDSETGSVREDSESFEGAIGDRNRSVAEIAGDVIGNLPDSEDMDSEFYDELVRLTESYRASELEFNAALARYNALTFTPSDLMDAGKRTRFRSELTLLVDSTTAYVDANHDYYRRIAELLEQYGSERPWRYSRIHSLANALGRSTNGMRKAYFEMMEYIEAAQSSGVEMSESVLTLLSESVGVAESDHEMALDAFVLEKNRMAESGR